MGTHNLIADCPTGTRHAIGVADRKPINNEVLTCRSIVELFPPLPLC
jgi:hypothetical protein